MNARGRVWLAIFLTAVAVRLLTLSAYPLYDTTEARYAEIARVMLATDNWVTPQIEPGEPFWAKPPLSIWATALSFSVLGINEFAARLPSLLFTLATACLILSLRGVCLNREVALGAATIYFTTGVTFIASGAVMTDAALTFATTLSMVSFWRSTANPNRLWRYLFFAGLGIGLLAKGPVAAVLTGLPLIAWLVSDRRQLSRLLVLPWVSGLALSALIALPWYLLAEARTPGFLQYFLIGEHLWRFVESGWAGDLYGSAHAYSRGTIWLFGLAAALPWTVVAVIALLERWLGSEGRPPPDTFGRYLLFWSLAPLVLFSFAGNILPAYVLPAIPAFAILLSRWIAAGRHELMHCGWLTPVLLLAIIGSGALDTVSGNSQKALVAYHEASGDRSRLIFYPKKPLSAAFYSAGNVHVIDSRDALLTWLGTPGYDSIAIRKSRVRKLPATVRACLRIDSVFTRYVLFDKPPHGCAAFSQAAKHVESGPN